MKEITLPSIKISHLLKLVPHHLLLLRHRGGEEGGGVESESTFLEVSDEQLIFQDVFMNFGTKMTESCRWRQTVPFNSRWVFFQLVFCHLEKRSEQILVFLRLLDGRKQMLLDLLTNMNVNFSVV